ncbi:MAG: nucleoside transporter [Planctomycetes bacterium]|nr:nucleoside transporter [Planctomycetota bacterium]
MNESESLTERVDKLYEFEREPVSEDKLESGKHFAALFAGEHVAGTEFVIGAAFVAWGASAADVLIGLLIGNALAVLSWTFICAPIAVRTRLTLYWYLRKIAGPGVTAVYNVLNAFLFCILSGTMITVSASAIRIPFGIAPQTKWYPEDMRFVFIVLVVGAVVVGVAIMGFKRLAQFSEVCVPWLFVMFTAGAIGTLPVLANASPGMGSIDSIADLWRIAQEQIWLHKPESGLGVWHITAFAWICNLAFHVGLSDMAVLRYAPRASYGVFSACGMYLGHYLAWVCAGVMGAAAALILQRPLAELDAGEVAYQALGLAGILAVIIAGWATSNPTLYRAGLALQAVTPGWPRWLVTLLAGIATTVVACFPFVFTKLLSFVALFGILLSPVGAIVFVEHWLFPRLGFRQYWFSATDKSISWPALLAWASSVGIALGLWFTETLHEFFIAIPLWFVAAALYTVFAAAAGARTAQPGIKEDLVSAVDSNQTTARIARSQPAWLRAVGVIALVSLLAQVLLPFWVMAGGNSVYESKLPSYHFWLGAASVIHLVTIAAWVLIGEQTVVRPTDESADR